MMERAQFTVGLLLIILAVVLTILGILVWRHGRTPETKAILDAIKGGRQQWDVEHGALQDDVRTIKGWMRRLMARFGFVADKDLPEPPVSPRKPKDDCQ